MNLIRFVSEEMRRFISALMCLIMGASLSAQELSRVVSIEISEEEYTSALAEMPKYNYALDTNISVNLKTKIRELIKETLTKREKEWLESDDLSILGIGQFPTQEYYALIWQANDQEAVFITPDLREVSLRIIGSDQWVYSKEEVYAGYKTFDCDSYVNIHVYDTPEPGKLRMIAIYKNLEMAPDPTIDMPAMLWHNRSLYCRWESHRLDDWGTIHYINYK